MKKPTPSARSPSPAAARYRSGVALKALPLLREAERCLLGSDFGTAERHLALAMLHAPGHAWTLLLLGRIEFGRGLWAQAERTLQQAVLAMPDEPDLLVELGRAQSAAGHAAAAMASMEQACALRADPATLIEWGTMLDAQARAADALAVADRVVALDASHAKARLLRARCLQAMGRIDETAAEYRELIRRRLEVPAAWFALLDIKTIRLEDAERKQLERDAADTRWNDIERSYLHFALGQSCEDAADYPAAVAAFDRANRLVRRRTRWNAPGWNDTIDALLDTFDVDGPSSDETGQPGSEVIFIVGLPRSGTTLIEQILGAHSQVEGANELPDMAAVIDAESARRRRPFPQWAADASDDDWRRMGSDYLERTRRWRSSRPIHTDKMPENWPYAGAIRKMLPGARIIDSRRDPVETAWSCYKQLFAPNRVAYSYDVGELADYWRSYDRFMAAMSRRHASAIHVQSHEMLAGELEQGVRSLLEFCRLPWQPACLEPHLSRRAVRTASAGQVREPVRRRVPRALSYGASLNEFQRIMLA